MTYRLGDGAALTEEPTPVRASRLMGLLGRPVAGWRRVDDRRVVLAFADGGEVHLIDDSDAYEAVQFLIGGREIIVWPCRAHGHRPVVVRLAP